MDRMFAPWRRAFVEGALAQELPSPTGCIFCDFPRRPGEAPPDGSAPSVWDRARLVVTSRPTCFVILNKFPYNNGHVMVVPRLHTHRLEDLDDGAFTELSAVLRETVAAVRGSYAPHGMNVGMNMGKAAGAGIDEHIHWHVLPRWSGDSNFMPAIMETKVISEGILDTYDRLAKLLRTPDDDSAQ